MIFPHVIIIIKEIQTVEIMGMISTGAYILKICLYVKLAD